jgi:CheY-like chemotaxis protein
MAIRKRPDLIIMDIRLPRMDGLEVTRKLRENSAFSHTPIIAITAYAMKGDKEMAIKAGCNAYLSKPFNIHELTGMITEMLPPRQKDNP